MRNEKWKWITRYENKYQISSMGRVFHINNISLLKGSPDKDGYICVSLWKNSKTKTFKIHRLVALAFISNPNSLPQINHINEIKYDNRRSNLEWSSSKHNVNHGGAIARRSKSVIQLSLEGLVVKIWKSTREPEIEGFFHGAISACCKKKPKYYTHKGYRWKYLNE